MPNLLLAVSAVVSGAPSQMAASLRAAGGVEAMISLLEMRSSGGPSELHTLALQVLHAVGETRPERSARMLADTTARRSGPSAAVEAAATVQAVRALGRLVRPLVQAN